MAAPTLPLTDRPLPDVRSQPAPVCNSAPLAYDPLAYGAEPGLRFASLLDGQGGCRVLDWQGILDWQARDGFLWVHLERDAAEAAAWIYGGSEIDPAIGALLLAEDSRPRVEVVEDALLLVLRGVNLSSEAVELVPIHIWIDANRAITLRDQAHALMALREIRQALAGRRGPRRAGELLVQISEKIVRDLEPALEKMDEEVERLEDDMLKTTPPDLRRTLADLRRRAIHLRRYLHPQREALFRLQTADTPLLNAHDRMRLSSVIDTVIRYIEDLDAIRDRTTILQEDLSARVSEQIAKISNRLTGIAALLLTPSLLAGMLGANIGGIPGGDHPWGFAGLVALIVALLLVQLIIFRRIKWL